MAKHIFSGSGAPATTPTGIGHHYIDTDNDNSYISVGTSSSADWKLMATGTVTSVALSMPDEFSVAGSPVTSSGTLAVTKATQDANLVYAGPTTGSAAAPAFRSLVADDIPELSLSNLSAGVVDEDLSDGTSASHDTVPSALATKTYADTKPTISSGSGAPGSTPTKVGDIYIDTTGDWAYIAVGTSSSADWRVSKDVASDAIWDAKGNLAVGTGADTAAKLTVGTDAQLLAADSTQTTGLAWVTRSHRDKLSANRTYYVRTDGSDSNTGLVNDSSGAFLTVQKAINTVRDLDLNGYIGTVRVGAGTYSEALTVPVIVGGTAQILGDTTTPANVIISAPGACFTASYSTNWTIRGFTLQSSSGNGRGFVVNDGARITIGDIDFSTMTGTIYHIYAVHGHVGVTTSYTISAGANRHIRAENYAVVKYFNPTITLTGTPAFSTFAEVLTGGLYYCTPATFSGSATGTRYSAVQNGLIYTNGGGATYLPGDVAGSTATQGQYL